MARIRSIKPEFWSSEQVVSVSRDARLLFIGLWNFCDDAGRHKASVLRLKMEVLPGDAVSTKEVTQWVRELIEADLVEEYEFDGETYWQVTGWHHQRIDNAYIKHPGPDGKKEKPTRRLGGKQRQLLYKKLVERDGEKCVKCGATNNLAIDHKIPRSKGGTHDLENLQLLCKPCNNEKLTSVSEGTREVLAGDAPPDIETDIETDLDKDIEKEKTRPDQTRPVGSACGSVSFFDELVLKDISRADLGVRAKVLDWASENIPGIDEDLRVKILACSVRARKVGKDPPALFLSLVRTGLTKNVWRINSDETSQVAKKGELTSNETGTAKPGC